MRIKVLLICDNPNIDTGQGVIHRNIGIGLKSRGFDVVSIGWGESEKVNKNVDWRIYPTSTDPKKYYGGYIFDEVIKRELPDVVITIGDVWNFGYVVSSNFRKYFLWVGYTAIDGEAYGGGVPESWLRMFNDMDRIVTYTEYGKQAILKSYPINPHKIAVINHGINLQTFRRLSKKDKIEIRKKYSIPQDVIIYLIVARNQFRKNIPEIMKAWVKFKEGDSHPKAILWPHMTFTDPFGHNINELVRLLKIKDSIAFFEVYANAQVNTDTIPDEHLNELYNLSDVVMLLSGEGFGFPLVEAMAAGKPIIALNHSACKELVGDVGELVDVGYYVTGVHSTERPYPDCSSLVKKMSKLYYDENLRNTYAELSWKKSVLYDWNEIAKMWGKYLQTVINPFQVNCESFLETIC